ncbi:hypothetical protein F2P81_006485 [Scophthalmus maximus]|uniref:Uncharacterized protein n=1 Tax=Scophthalmus maximus TaxID=52904 RepID=A0A6A4T383_SCOMX|nr:hypothetical protein F2P81_006485 [Scophthalmus maximus]
MKKIFSFTKKKKHQSGTPDSGSVLSLGYELKDKDLGKVHKAASVGDLAKLKQLAKKKDVNQLDKENRTALHIACASGHVEVVQFLVESKAKLNLCDNQNRSALMKTVQGQHERCLSILLENHAEPNLVDINGNTALHLAANIPSISIAILLLQHEANINAQNKEGFAPLTVAVREDHIEMAEFLLKESADVDCMDKEQRSPLMIAAGNGQIGMLRLLLRFNADISLKDTKGQSADHYAVKNGHHGCSLLIIEHGTQRNDGPSLSHQDFEDYSQSESLSRVSKSATDEWPSSADDDDDDNNILLNKKLQKVDRVVERGKSNDSEQPSSSKARSDSLEGSQQAEDSEEEVGEEEEDEDEDEEEEDDEEEEEEEEEESDQEDDDEESDEDGEEEEEEDECEEEEEDGNAASVKANTSEYEEIPKPSVTAALDFIDSADISHNGATTPRTYDDSEKDAKTDTQNAGLAWPPETPSYAMPKTLNIEDDCVVSAIRVESKFSDEDDSIGKECMCEVKEEEFEREMEKGDDGDDSWSIKQNSGDIVWNDSDDEEDNQTGGFGRNTVLANQRNVLPEVGLENVVGESDAEDDARSKKEEKGRSSWGSSLEDSDGDLPEEEVKELDQTSDVQASDLQQEAVMLHEKSTLPQPNQDHADSSWDSSSPVVLSSKCLSPKQMVEKRKSSPGVCLTSSPQTKRRPAKATVDGSEWDSSSEYDESDNGSCTKGKVVSTVSKTNVTPNKTGEQHCSDCCLEEDEGIHEKKSNDPSPAVSPAPDGENTTRNQILDNDDVDSVSQTSQIDEKPDLENEKSDDSSWDDDDESDESEKPKTKDDEVAECGDVWKKHLSTSAGLRSPKSKPTSAVDQKFEEEAGVDNIDDSVDGKESTENNRPEEEEKLANVKRSNPSVEDEMSEDSDSMDQRVQYDFASATVKVSDVGDDSDDMLGGCVHGGDKSDDELEAKLTAFVPLKDDSATFPQTRVSSRNTDEEPHRGNIFSSALAKDEVAQCHNWNTFTDQALPQTDIDNVDLDSPDEAESTGMINRQLKNIEKEESIENEEDDDDDDDKEQTSDDEEEEEEEGHMSDENDQPAESGESLGATSTVPETEKDKKRVGNDNHGKEHLAKDDTTQKETEKAKWEPLSVLSKLGGDKDQKTDLMEELGLGDIDDLEDASDWDSASTTSKRTLPGLKMASPGLDEFPECTTPSIKEQDEDVTPAAPPTPQRSICSDGRLPSSPPRLLPHPQPRARKMVPQKPQSEEDSDWEPDNVTSSNTVKIDNRLQNIAEPQAVVKAGSPELTSMERDGKLHKEPDEPQHKENDDAGYTCELDLNSRWQSGRVGSDRGENCTDLRDRRSPEERGEEGNGVPWEKRYEKLWVEVEKREVKSTFKNVAGELKEKFGELLESRCPAEDVAGEEQATADSTSEEEASSDEDEGEIIVRPAARARSTVLLTIPEQRESGLEDSMTESTDNSLCEDALQVCRSPASDSSVCQGPGLLTDDALEKCRFSAPPATTAQREGNMDHTGTAYTDGHIIPTSDIDSSSFLKDETNRGQFHKQKMDLILKDQSSDPHKADMINASSEDDLEEATKSCPPLPSRHSASTHGVSDEEEGMERFKLEVGMLKVVFMDLEKEKAQLQKEVGKEMTKTTVEVQKSSASWDTGGMILDEVGTEKPETWLGCLSGQPGAIRQEQQPAATKSVDGAPEQTHLPLRQTHTSNTQEGQAVEETLKLELVRGARRSRAPQTNTHVNGDPLSVFDDSTLSDVSDDEGRSPSSGQQQNENTDEMELAEEFDELTQSSDTATDDLDSPTSGYRHASLLIQKLDSATLDSRSMVKLQNIFHEYERSIQKARSRHGYLTDKVNQLEMERSELKSSLEEVKDFKSALERNQLELQTEVTNLKFQLKQEQENRRNATMMYNTTRDKLRRTEEQHQLEVQERQKVELALRNLELEMRTLVNNIKQLEEEHRETQRVLAQERSARTLQENLLNSHLRKQQEIDEENKRNISRSNEVSDRERELLQQTATLHEQLTILRTDLERSQANSNLKASHIMEENEALKEQLEDARRDLKLNSEALTQTVFNYNNQVTNLKSELAMITNRLENDRQTREALELEVESTRSRLAGTVKEAERCLAAHADTEKCLLREKEEHQRLKDRLTGDAASQRETVSSLSQKLAKAEACSNSMENEVHRVTLQLTEKGLLLEVLQREKDQAASRVKELEMALQAERELVSRSTARQGATQELLAQAQSQCMLLRQQLEEAQNKGVAKERAVTDAQDRFSDILSKLRSDCEERVQLVEERNKELASKAADLRDQIYKLEEEKNERETSLRQLQQELADSLKKLSMSEASLEVNTRYRNDLEEEKARLLKDMDRLKGKVQKQSVLSHTAQDSQALWEEELKSRSKLGLRLAELEKEKGELNTQMEIEKKKAKKVAEQKKAVDTRLDQEMKRNTDLQKEMYRLRTLLKTAKKKLRDQDTAGAEFGSPMSSLRMDLGRHSQAEGGYGRMKEKVDNLQVQLEKEASRRSQLEEVNGELKDQLASLKRFAPSTDQLERSKRQLEEEVLDLRRQMETAQMEPSHVEQCRREAEERARQEIQQKLEQVNLFLQSQAASQEALDQIRMANEAKLRSQLEQKIRELEGEVGRARTTQHDSLTQRDSTRTELERYRQLYTEELHLRKSMTAKLERANRRLAEANSKLLNERSRSFITSSIANGSLGSPALDVGTSPANYGATLGPLNRGLGLGLSILRPVTDTQNSRVEDYLAKVQSELDRNISKELNNAERSVYTESWFGFLYVNIGVDELEIYKYLTSVPRREPRHITWVIVLFAVQSSGLPLTADECRVEKHVDSPPHGALAHQSNAEKVKLLKLSRSVLTFSQQTHCTGNQTKVSSKWADSESKEALRGNSKPETNSLSAKTITDISQNTELRNLRPLFFQLVVKVCEVAASLHSAHQRMMQPGLFVHGFFIITPII